MRDTTASDAARLEMNGRHHQPDPEMEHVLRLWTDNRPAYNALPGRIKSRADIYRDLKQSYLDAVAAGVITPPSGSAA